ncbi:hypothetical protein [uncultured Enterovirga sp.]|uniref:hypothetical protein n=1 Tax=uncultured Enterovirga sp. TaxID=2026352 RepID=UPI0035CA85DD
MGMTAMEDVDASVWPRAPDNFSLAAQTLLQRNGWAITLLHAIERDEADDLGVEDAFERSIRFGR